MLERLIVREGQKPEAARRSLDVSLGVDGWAVPGRESRSAKPRDPGAPWWWKDAEDASQGFLRSMGVRL